MNAVLLAAGKGERLGPHLDNIPKVMVRFEGKPVLERNVEQLRDAGVRTIYVHVHHLAHVIRDYFGDGSRFGVSIEYCDGTPTLPGTAGAVKQLEAHLGAEAFFVIYGDSYSNYRLDELRLAHVGFRQRDPGTLATIGLWPREDVIGKAGIVGLNPDGIIDRIVEKPKREQLFPGYLVNTGHYVLEPAVLAEIPSDRPSDFAMDVFPALIADRSLRGIELTGWLRPYDTPELLARWRTHPSLED